MRKRKSNSQSVKSWARHLYYYGHAPIQIQNPQRYLHSKARQALNGGIIWV